MKMEPFQGASGRWYCNDIHDLQKWYEPPRKQGIALDDFVKILHRYRAHLTLKNETLIYYWDNYLDCMKFCNAINKNKLEVQK